MLGMQVLVRVILASIFLAAGWVALDSLAATAQDKKEQPKEKQEEPKVKKGTVVGEVVGKSKNTIKVKAFGEEKAREYFPHWRGGLPKDGGGLDKKMLATFEKLKVGQKVRLTWEWVERFRAVEVQILDKNGKEAPDKK